MCATGDTETNWNSIFKEISFRKARTYFMKNLHKCMQVLFHLFMLYCIVYCIIILWRSHLKLILKDTALRDGSGWGSFNRSTLKSQERRVSQKSVRPPSCESPLKIRRHLVQYCNLLLVSYFPTVHTATVGFLLHRTRIGKCAMKKLGSIPNGGGNFYNHHLSFSNRKTRENAPQGLSYRQWLGRNDFCCSFCNQRCTTLFHLSKLLNLFRILQRRNELSSPPIHLVYKFPIKKTRRCTDISKGSYRMRAGRNFKRISEPVPF